MCGTSAILSVNGHGLSGQSISVLLLVMLPPYYAVAEVTHHGSSNAQSMNRRGRCQWGSGCSPSCTALPDTPDPDHVLITPPSTIMHTTHMKHPLLSQALSPTYKYIFVFFGCIGFVAVHGLSLVVASEGYSSLWFSGFSLWWLLLLQSMGSRHAGLSSCGTRAQQLWLTGSRVQAQ